MNVARARSCDQMVWQMVCAVQVGNIDLVFVDIKAADRAVIEHEPGSHPQGSLTPGKFEHGGYKAHEKTPVTDEGDTMDRLTFLVAVTGEKLRKHLFGAWLAFLVSFIRAVPPARFIQIIRQGQGAEVLHKKGPRPAGQPLHV